MIRLLIIAIVTSTLFGCAVRPPMYSWGEYESSLYASYKDPSKVEALQVTLESQIAESERLKQKVPPGMYAELGTLYLQSGKTDTAIAYYSKERNAWPESRGMMDALIKSLELRKNPPAEQAAK